MISSQLKNRLIIGSFCLFILFLSIYYSKLTWFKPIFIALNIFILSTALLEYYKLAKRKGSKPLTLLGIGTTAFYLMAIGLKVADPFWSFLPFFVLFISLFIGCCFFFTVKDGSAIINLSTTFFGIIYLILPLSCAIEINYFYSLHSSSFDGRLWLTYGLVVIKMTDIGAYFFGKMFGKHPLALWISPKKTIEGAIGGIFCAVVASLAFSFVVNHFFQSDFYFIQSICLGLVLSFFAQVGDLSESILKRDADVKDSSHLPGLGGVLDIVDSLIFTLPLLYFFLVFHLV